ncbi:ABC transporter permease [Bosea sp. (in: a-proteobacteria)]|uniref:ABC transporter permease n=1 Tax=Bosea sp. (in: a-proteobacteria) TaxID=1871050 RepID=UPI00260A8C12|nr:ABC transporter permease [Bosea sp. (in: a-proteobacteria)]MCO5089507.1 ABC transporter permease [Bosea sp. (in: a-proteobacteria)]
MKLAAAQSESDGAAGAWARGISGYGALPRSLRYGLPILALIILAAIFAPWIAPYDPLANAVRERLQGPSMAHWLGTDATGRDVLSRLIFGARESIRGVLIAICVAGGLALPWGLAAGYLGRFWDEVLMRLADAMLAFPGLILALAIGGVLGPSLTNAMIAMGIVYAPSCARLLRSAVLPLRRADFVLVARTLGASATQTAIRHVLPNAMAPFLVQLCSVASLALLAEGALSFLGLGAQAPTPSWGSDLAKAYLNFRSAPLLTIAPGITIACFSFLLAQVGNGVREWLRTE